MEIKGNQNIVYHQMQMYSGDIAPSAGDFYPLG